MTAAHVETAAEIHIDDRAPSLFRHLVEGAVAVDPGIVHEDVDRS